MRKFFCLGVLALAACQYTETGKTCAVGPGLKTTAYTGANLANNQLALTFDGSAGAPATAIGDYLFANGIQAAFFVDGASIADGGKGGILGSLKGQAHLIGNRGYTATALGDAHDVEREVRKTDRLILPYVTGDMFLLRSNGSLSSDAATRLNDAGLSRYVGPIGWDVTATTLTTDDNCWAQNTLVADCANGYLTALRAQNHGIVRLHSDDGRTADLLRLIVPQLKTETFTFVRLDAIPEIQDALLQSGGKPGTLAGAPGCDEY